MCLQDKDNWAFIDYLHRKVLSHIRSLVQECDCCESVSPKPRDSSQAVALLNNAKSVQAPSAPHAVCLATEAGIFHLVPPLERAPFFSSCFIDTGGSGSLQCVWLFSSGKYWCICEATLIWRVLFGPRWCPDPAQLICVRAFRFCNKSVNKPAAVRNQSLCLTSCWDQRCLI